MAKPPLRKTAALTVTALLITGCGMKCYKSHYAVKGETIDDVCERYEISRDALMKENRVEQGYALKTGDRVFIPCENYEKGEKKPAHTPKTREAQPARKSGGEAAAPPPPPVSSLPPVTPPKVGTPGAEAKKKETKPAPGPMPPATVKFGWPLENEVIRGFTDGRDAAGNGLDLKAEPGAAVRAAADGKIEYAGTPANAYGPMVLVSHADNFYTVYSRLGAIAVKKGNAVIKGATVGTAGTEGYVHFEIRAGRRAVDPVLYLPKR